MLKGIIVSRGLALGELYVHAPYEPKIKPGPCLQEEAMGQQEAYQLAKAAATGELEGLIGKLQKNEKEESGIFFAHLEILNDEVMDEEIVEAILGELMTAGEAVDLVYRSYAKAISGAKDTLIQERARDMDDVRKRLLRNIEGLPEPRLDQLQGPCIVAAKDFLPSEITKLDPALILGLVAQEGSSACHAAIMARNAGIPTVFGVEGLLEHAKSGQKIILDAEQGQIFLEPDRDRWEGCQKRAEHLRSTALEAQAYRERECVTQDGRRIEICLNLGNAQAPPELSLCDGVGLLRSEFLFMDSDHLPTEEEQFQAYKKVLEAAGGKPVTLRTLDIGGDKQLKYLPLSKEENPFLGIRALRLCMRRPEILRTQLRAALRASVCGTLWLMFPMVGSMEDWGWARSFYEGVRRELISEGKKVSEHIPLGVMIEIPSMALMASKLAKEVDFASVGTNDLCQYLFAADRTNPAVEPYAQKYAPVLLRLLGGIADEFEKARKPLSICGELGGDELAAAVLVGLGYRKLSMSPVRIGPVKRMICKGRYMDMKRLARAVVEQDTQDEAIRLLKDYEKENG